MFDAIFMITKKNFYTGYNVFLYSVRKIPLFGKLFPRKLYNLKKIHSIIPFFAILYGLISAIFVKLLGYIGFVFLNMVHRLDFPEFKSLINSSNTELFLHFAVFFMIIYTIFITSYFYQFDNDDYIFIKDFRINSKNYKLGNRLYKNFVYLISTVVVLGGFFKFQTTNLGFHNAFYLGIFFVGLRNLIQTIQLKLNIKNFVGNKIIISTKIAIGIVVFLIFFVIPFFLKRVFDFTILLDKTAFWVGLILIFIESRILDRKLVEDKAIEMLNVGITETPEELNDLTLDKINVDSIKNTKKNFNHLSGFEYLDEIYNDRTKSHRYLENIFKKFSLTILFIILSVFAILAGPPEDDKLLVVQIAHVAFFFIPYALFSGNSRIKEYFINMDKCFIKYNYYRTPGAIISQIKVRMKSMIKFEIIPIISYILLSICVGIGFRFSISDIIILFSFSVAGILFFKLHYLAIYYIMQPFTSNGVVVNPLYKTLPYILFWFVFLNAKEIGFDKLRYGIVIFIPVYIFLVILGVKHLSPKYFREK